MFHEYQWQIQGADKIFFTFIWDMTKLFQYMGSAPPSTRSPGSAPELPDYYLRFHTFKQALFQ